MKKTKEMINAKNEFSLFDFCKKRADKVQIYGEETLDEEGNVIPFIDQAALITHYLQLRKRNVDMPYAQQAEGILNLWYEFVKGEKQKANHFFVGESSAAIQGYLFPDLFQAPFQAMYTLRNVLQLCNVLRLSVRQVLQFCL